ncbi:MAG: right-handed parallel beta-helix repeat-containing protein [Promethearchaeota archaeon]
MPHNEEKHISKIWLTITIIFVGIIAFNSILLTFNTSMTTGKKINNTENVSIPEFKNSVSLPKAATLHAPISIDGNDWTTSGVATGSGTKSDPYVIANLTIVADGSAYSTAISIKNSQVYGILRNVTLINSSYGIWIENSEKISIENNSFTNCSEYGVYLTEADYCNITGNLMENFQTFAISSISSGFSVIANNTIRNSFRGIYIFNSILNSIYNNQIYDNDETAIIMDSCNLSLVEQNTMKNNKIWGLAILKSNAIIVNSNFLMDNIYEGMKLDSSTINCTVSNNTIHGNALGGLYVYHQSNDNIIENNSITYNSGYGISFDDDSSSNEVSENTLIKNTLGSLRNWGNNNSIHDNVIIEMPKANFTSSKSPVSVNVPVNFTDTSIGGIPPLTYNWDFGDGESSNEQNPSHNYTTAGDYNVSLTITDKDGDFSTFSMHVIINEAEKESKEIAGYPPLVLLAVAGFMITAIIIRNKKRIKFFNSI